MTQQSDNLNKTVVFRLSETGKMDHIGEFISYTFDTPGRITHGYLQDRKTKKYYKLPLAWFGFPRSW